MQLINSQKRQQEKSQTKGAGQLSHISVWADWRHFQEKEYGLPPREWAMRQQENRQQRQTQTKKDQETEKEAEAHREIDSGRREVELGCGEGASNKRQRHPAKG